MKFARLSHLMWVNPYGQCVYVHGRTWYCSGGARWFVLFGEHETIGAWRNDVSPNGMHGEYLPNCSVLFEGDGEGAIAAAPIIVRMLEEAWGGGEVRIIREAIYDMVAEGKAT